MEDLDQPTAVQGLGSEKRKRLGVLSLLCTKRMNQPDQPTLTIVELEQLLGVPREHLEISLWYLRETGRIQRGDSGKYILPRKGWSCSRSRQRMSQSVNCA